MILAERQDQTPEHDRNPLRLPGGYVLCPRCGRRGQAWAWLMREEPSHAAYTVPVYECRRSADGSRGCGHRFALRP